MEKKELLELLHQRMIEEVQDYAIILMDIDGTILTWNKGAELIKGYRAEQIIGQNFRLFYLPQHREQQLPEQLLQQAVREGRLRHIGQRVRKNGTTFWGSVLITALHDDENRVVGFTKLTRELRDNEIA
ncbi:PAS domain-containing protein [Flaviaesturariibacter aridisoli]|nr:PAS domain-containing protein [Flaviaesturariibacter aridisoli]